MLARQYVFSIPGGTATTSIQITKKGTLERAILSIVAGAAGTWELSKNGTSQIATSTEVGANGVLARARIAPVTTSGLPMFIAEFNFPKIPFNQLDYIYVHCTGAGNVGEITLE